MTDTTADAVAKAIYGALRDEYIPFAYQGLTETYLLRAARAAIAAMPTPATAGPITFIGPTAEHNLMCWHCGIWHAIYYVDDDVFRPCWDCQERLTGTANLGVQEDCHD